MLAPMSAVEVPLRSAIAALPAYVPGARPEPGRSVHKLSSNENPYPPLPSVLAAIADAAAEVNRYPDMYAAELTAAIAARWDVPVESVVPACGSVAALGHVLEAVCEPGDEVLFGWRSFEAYPISARIAGASPVTVSVQRTPGDLGRLDLQAMAEAVTRRTRVVLVCTPNNPTGPVVHADELDAFLADVPPDVLVVLDEAYLEFVRDPKAAQGLAVFAAHPNVVLLRTFSKAYGLAGLRVGYAIAHPRLAAGIRAATTPFGVSHVAQAAALASLAAEDELLRRVDALVAERVRLIEGLRAQGWTVPDSEANFAWLELGAATAQRAREAQEAGVLLRPFAGEGLRVSVGEAASTDRFLELAAGWRPR